MSKRKVTMKIYYDDDLMAIMVKINAALESRGLKFVDDDQVHDGWAIYTLEPLRAADSMITE